MSSTELKLKIFKEIELLDEKGLQEAYGVLLNFFNSKEESSDWGNLSEKQKSGLLLAVKQLNAGKGIPHKKVMKKYRKRYHG